MTSETRSLRARLKWGVALVALVGSVFLVRGLRDERLDPEDLLRPSAERAANARAMLSAAPAGEVRDPARESAERGRELYEEWRFGEAREALELALELDPNAAEAYFNLGLVELRQPGDLLRSEALFEKAIEIDPEDGRFPLGLAGAIGAKLMNSGSLLKGAASLPRIKELLKLAVELDPDSIDARNALFQFYLRVPGLLGGGAERAAEQARELERIDGIEGLVARAQIEGNEKRFEEAEALYRRAVQEGPDRGQAYRALGAFLAERERFADSLEAFQDYARLEAADPGAHDSLGGGYMKLGRHGEAAACFRHALELNPDSLMAALHLAACLDESGDEEGAATLYRGVVARVGESPWADSAREWLEEYDD